MQKTNAKQIGNAAKPGILTANKPASTNNTKSVPNSTVSKPAPSTTTTKTVSNTTTKTSINNATKPAVKTATKPANSQPAKSLPKKLDNKTVNQPQKVETKVVEEKKEPVVEEMKVENIGLKQLLNKIEYYRDNNIPLLIIDKLEMNDSFTFFKYKGYVADIAEYSIKELANAQDREKSIESARKQAVIALKVGGTLVFNIDKMQTDLKEFFKDAPFFIPEKLFVSEETRKEEYYVKSLLKVEENVDGFGNKGGYTPHKDYSAVILSKSTDVTPDELIKKLNMPPNFFQCIIIS